MDCDKDEDIDSMRKKSSWICWVMRAIKSQGALKPTLAMARKILKCTKTAIMNAKKPLRWGVTRRVMQLWGGRAEVSNLELVKALLKILRELGHPQASKSLISFV
jgi:hypothetical protein